MTLCLKCGKDGEFRPNKRRKNGLQAYCIDCDKEYQREWYSKNKVSAKARAIRNNNINRTIRQNYVLEYLKSHPCSDCGEADVRVLEFDHRGDKTDTICNMLRKCVQMKTLMEEISKCDVRCANCHKKKTATDFNWYKNGS